MNSNGVLDQLSGKKFPIGRLHHSFNVRTSSTQSLTANGWKFDEGQFRAIDWNKDRLICVFALNLQ
jgi:hypothetical protein